MRILRKKKINPGIIHTIPENIIISEFSKFFEDFVSYVKTFTENANIGKMGKQEYIE